MHKAMNNLTAGTNVSRSFQQWNLMLWKYVGG